MTLSHCTSTGEPYVCHPQQNSNVVDHRTFCAQTMTAFSTNNALVCTRQSLREIFRQSDTDAMCVRVRACVFVCVCVALWFNVDCRQLTQLLTDIVYFVAYQENNVGDPFTVQLTHSDRERPKLLREQNVLKQVIARDGD